MTLEPETISDVFLNFSVSSSRPTKSEALCAKRKILPKSTHIFLLLSSGQIRHWMCYLEVALTRTGAVDDDWMPSASWTSFTTVLTTLNDCGRGRCRTSSAKRCHSKKHKKRKGRTSSAKRGHSKKHKKRKGRFVLVRSWTFANSRTRSWSRSSQHVVSHSELTLWKTILAPYAVFKVQGSSASQMTAAKVPDVVARLPGCAGQASDAVSAYTQAKVEDAPIF